MRRLAALLVLPLLLTACGGGSGSASGSGPLAGVTVNGPEGKSPTVQIKNDFSVDKTTSTVVSQGDGAKVAEGSTVLVDFVAKNAKTGKTFADTYKSGQPQTFTLSSAAGLPPGIVKSLVGKHGGDRVAAAVPPSDMFGPQGNPQAQVGAKDTVVLVFDIEQASDPDPLPDVQGKSAKLPASMPQLQVDSGGTPTGFTADAQTGPPLKSLMVHPLIQGDGPTVQAGDLLTVNYLGQIYPDGKIFDQSYSRGQPATFQIGAGSLIPAWDKGLVGLKEGSRVVIVAPPDEGYGAQGNSQAGIKGTDTLIFVVDILGVS